MPTFRLFKLFEVEEVEGVEMELDPACEHKGFHGCDR